MTPAQIKQHIRTWDKDAKSIKIVDSGATNLVGMTESAVYRFPITADALAIQRYEVELYKRLDGALGIPVPKLLAVYDDPSCMAITRLPGQHLSPERLSRFSDEDMRAFVRQLLEFSLALNSVIDPRAVRNLEETCIGDKAHERPWDDYLAMHLRDARFAEQPWLETLAHEQYARWRDIKDTGSLPTIVAHDELHDANLLFSDRKLSGIIDFGDSTVGTIAQELRQLLRIGESAARMAITVVGLPVINWTDHRSCVHSRICGV